MGDEGGDLRATVEDDLECNDSRECCISTTGALGGAGDTAEGVSTPDAEPLK